MSSIMFQQHGRELHILITDPREKLRESLSDEGCKNFTLVKGILTCQYHFSKEPTGLEVGEMQKKIHTLSK